jgi:hypothetical protein
MTRLRVEQTRVFHRGREFHFVSYDPETGGKAEIIGAQPMWFLMAGNRRMEAIRCVPEQGATEVEARLRRWLDSNAFA